MQHCCGQLSLQRNRRTSLDGFGNNRFSLASNSATSGIASWESEYSERWGQLWAQSGRCWETLAHHGKYLLPDPAKGYLQGHIQTRQRHNPAEGTGSYVVGPFSGVRTHQNRSSGALPAEALAEPGAFPTPSSGVSPSDPLAYGSRFPSCSEPSRLQLTAPRRQRKCNARRNSSC